jgi:predicted nucleic acid-binding Zn finger protein
MGKFSQTTLIVLVLAMQSGKWRKIPASQSDFRQVIENQGLRAF